MFILNSFLHVEGKRVQAVKGKISEQHNPYSKRTMRRPARPPPTGFKIAIPTASQKSVAVESRTAEDMKQQIYIHNDDSMVSPYISSDAPQFVDPNHHHITTAAGTSSSSNAEPPHLHMQPPHQAKFIHVNRTNIYVLVDGGSLFHDDHLHPHHDEEFTMVSGRSSMRDQIVREMTASASSSEFDEALAEVTTPPRNDLLGLAVPYATGRGGGGQGAGGRRLPRHSSDYEGMTMLSFIGGGQQGTVHAARLRNGMRCAVKLIDIHSATSANNDAERQGLKAGIVRELNMVKSLRDAPQAQVQYLVAAYNASCVIKDHAKRLSIYMELMGPSVESLQRTIGRMPHIAVTKIRQQAFAVKSQHSTPLKPADMQKTDWSQGGKERVPMGQSFHVDRQTQCPEILLSIIAHDVLRGLHDLHTTHCRVHCDLKPANILITEDFRTFKIGDFGCALLLGKDGSVVQRGVALGSKIYRAPEQFGSPTSSFDVGGGMSDAERSNSFDGALGGSSSSAHMTFSSKVDIWALGICLLELANGCHPTKPFQHDFWNFSSKLSVRHMVMPIQCTVSFYDFIEKCLCRDPNKRPSAQELMSHAFVKQVTPSQRKSLPTFVQKLTKECEEFQRKERLESLRLSVLTATKNRSDSDHHKRKSAATWRGFTHLLAPGAPPPTNDTDLFPQLGA
ncbi:protein kinase, putative [Bodo saltans]|uniref:mitogen-activated protein kinase kinase n=1 Tax=Bodo saltans TaxID=75058 RepID=A0A0S4IQ73_BODSA|nr:protein kinase, putative [Bodo saltans]|eukprot:CUE72613.1 protein kinase, putative [Bodo saltans]